MRMIELTDFFDKTTKEYVNVDEIARIEKFEETFLNQEEYEETVGFGPFKTTVTKKRYVNPHKRTGSKVIMKGKKDHTCVLETTTQVARLVQEA